MLPWLPPSMLLFFVFSAAASSVPLLMLVGAAAEDEQGGSLCPPTLCGGVNISFPFGIVPDHATASSCGEDEFQVVCLNNNTPYLGHNLNHLYLKILDIFYDNYSLIVADERKVQIFNYNTTCHISESSNTSSKVVQPFSISPANPNLILYSCTEAPPPAARERLVETICRNNTFVRLADDEPSNRSGGYYGSYFLEGCNATVVPVLGGYGAVDAHNYKELISRGFLLTWHLTPLPPLPKPTPQAAGGKRPLNIGMKIGIAAGVVVGVFLVCAVIFVWHKRKRMKQASGSNDFTRSGSSLESFSKDLELGDSPHIFTYEELEEATDGFSSSKELGDGGFGTVYKGKLQDGRVVAVKRLYKNNYKRVEQFLNEVKILSHVLHQNLVILYGCTSRSSRDLLLVYEFIPNGTVADHLHGPRATERGLTWPVRMNIAIETAEALAYLHAVEIIHRDVKTNNILLDNNFHVKVADFGLSRLYPLEVTHVSTVPQGTPGYVDPVYHQCYKLTDKSDVYSFGVVLVELISSKPAVDMSRSHSEINLANMALNRIQNREVEQLVDPELGYETNEETKRMIDLVSELAFQCLQLERDSRPSIKEVVEALICIKNGDCPGKKMDRIHSSPKEDSHLLKNSMQYSPDSVIHRFHSQSTTHSAASNASG